MQEPTPRHENSRVFLLAFRGVEIFYSTRDDQIFSALSSAPAGVVAAPSRAEAVKSERKPAR